MKTNFELLKFRNLVIVAFLLQTAFLYSDDKFDISHHEFRIGWGDMMFETVAFSNSPTHRWANPEAISPEYRVREKHHHTYSGHFFADYHYNIRRWLAVGMQTDIEAICWRETEYDRYHNPVGKTTYWRNYNLCFLPTVRFTYFHSQWVNLYSGLSIGMLLAFDNQHNAEVAPAFNLNLIGMCVGNNHWYGTLELGLLNAVRNSNKVYMVGSRIISVGIGYKF